MTFMRRRRKVRGRKGRWRRIIMGGRRKRRVTRRSCRGGGIEGEGSAVWEKQEEGKERRKGDGEEVLPRKRVREVGRARGGEGGRR